MVAGKKYNTISAIGRATLQNGASSLLHLYVGHARRHLQNACISIIFLESLNKMKYNLD